MSFKPLSDRILIRRTAAETMTGGGIIIPDAHTSKPQEGEIVAVGPGAKNSAGVVDPIALVPGDRVLFGQWAGDEIKIKGEDLLIMREADVIGKLG